jgi:hypothetical protein
MHDIHILTAAVTHMVYSLLRPDASAAGGARSGRELGTRDRGAVSLEQVLWFVAAGVAVAVIAGILWSAIETEANTPIVPPTAP